MEKITDYCTGCRACIQTCGHRAITMHMDGEGFLIPVIDHNKCTECKLCVERCPQNNIPEKSTPQRVLAVRDKDDIEIKKSASGGAFVVIARKILEEGGVVVGAAYDENMSVIHVLIDNVEDLYRLQSSKYVQSDTRSTYEEVKRELLRGKKVLYSSTPCQIGGLKSYLHKEYSNLLTVDVICHGVPSPKLFERYLDWLSLKMDGHILFYNFRDKGCGWGLDYRAKTKTKTKTKTSSCSLDPYYHHFLEGNTYRECCYKCKYCTKERVSDFTIGDYWGIQNEHPDFYSLKGVSCVLVNSEEGKRIWAEIKNNFYFLDSTFEQVARENQNLLIPTFRPAFRSDIYRELYSVSLKELFENRLKPPFNLNPLIKRWIPRKILILLKKYIKK